MAVPPFDILAATRSLESTGVPRAQAESIVGTVQQYSADLAADLATKKDLADSQSATQAAIDALRTKTEASINNLRADLNNLRTKTEASINDLRNEVKADLAVLKAELFRALWAHSLALATVILTGMGVLLTLFRMF